MCVLGWGSSEKEKNPSKIYKDRFLVAFIFVIHPPIFVASDTFGPIFHVDMGPSVAY